jgi:hypothetical protein
MNDELLRACLLFIVHRSYFILRLSSSSSAAAEELAIDASG